MGWRNFVDTNIFLEKYCLIGFLYFLFNFSDFFLKIYENVKYNSKIYLERLRESVFFIENLKPGIGIQHLVFETKHLKLL